ncbi:GatB/YqeY domain-containing protein [Sandaracinobacter sp. RS1-74]|uniref:GatB/YqeY domain-containing protein n=1 Tax=Sandaracinobacteroides sayramensis TaxID=2913411 RepID=UPI001EDA4512|nr:GatB/YqeY domain-containing protein [Sandaracinobacteroides sayramensis]MCG2840314.1 GatB/YqeY domain-containing protein [Sandaracinobacteroides sayramensis]
MIRDDIKTALITSMKAKETGRVSAIRLIQAAIKNRDIEARTGGAPADDDVLVMEVLGKMAKQRRESIEMFESGGREELAAAERAELEVIESFLPKQMSDEEAKAAIAELVKEAGATSVKDMGAVMALVKARLQGRMDMGKASGFVKAAIS